MKSVTFLAVSFILTFFSFLKWVINNPETGYFPEEKYYTLPANSPVGITLVPESACDSVTLFVQQLRTFPPSCCFQLILDNKLKNAIAQIKLDIITATFKNIVVDANQGWIVSQTPQMDILLSHNSGFIPVGGSSPLSFCLMGGNNPDSLKISYNYSAMGATGTCLVNTTVCSDPAPCDAAFSVQPIGSCGNFQFANQSTGTPPLTYSWNFGDPGSGSGNTSTSQNPSHQFSKCGDFIVCLKTTAQGCVDSICKTIAYFDVIKPVITCPANLTLRCNTNTSPASTGTATATDNCTPTGSIIITFSDVVSGTMPCNGLITRTWQAKDACNNISTCVQTISIQDNIPPAITCPANATVNTNPGACFYTGNIPQATATDNCDPTLDFTYSLLTAGSSILINAQTQFPKGVNTITCFAKDDCGNQSQNCSFTLTVVDNQPPTITCPVNMTVNGTINAQGQCRAIVNNIAPVVTDNCPMVSTTYSISGATTGSGNTNASGTNFMQGLSTVTYTATDMGGNIRTCSFNITVNCPRPKCDSISASLTPQIFPASPYACLFGLNISNQAGGISEIRITIKTATVSGANINAPFIGNFFAPNLIVINHPSGSIPPGNSIPVGFNITGGSNPDTAMVRFLYNNGQSSCDTNIIFNCPVPPVFKCDSAFASLIFFPSIFNPCNFQMVIDNQASNLTKIEVDLKTISPIQTFAVLIPYNTSQLQLGATSFTLHNAVLPIPKGKFPAVQFAINGGSNPDTAFIKFYYNNSTVSCDTSIIFNCPSPPPRPKCDSVSAFLVPFQAIPYACTYQFHVNNQASAISKIQIDLKTATFNSAGIVSPFTPVISPASRLTITHPSGFIPIGNFHTADLGINPGSNPDTAMVKFFYNNGQSACDTNIIFNCPVDTTCGYSPSCATTSISLNTGVGANGQLLAPGSFDPNWTIIQTPYTGLNLPRPAEVVTPYSSWALQPDTITPCAQWISVFQGADKGSGPRFTYSKCFCVCKDRSPITIQLSALADNEADFWLYDASGNIIATLLGVHPIGNNSSTPFILPPDTSTTTVILNKGTYCIRAGVKNWTRVTGINVCGSITGPGLIKADCCESNSYITGIKYEDTLCNGLPYSGQPKLSGWQIILCDATGNAIDTVTTDASGYYSFGPLKPGNYSVKEINKPGWTLSNPASNLVQMVLDTHDVQHADFGNCPPTLCDSISFWVESLHTIPPECCFRLHIDNLVKNKFTQIPLNLFSASFNSITVDNLNGWFTSQTSLSHINLTHTSGFIPVGSFTPITWCINKGSNPDTIRIKAEYLVGPSKVSCDTSFVFFCPPQPDTTCGIRCKADSISLNTGMDHSTGQFYANGSYDPYWTIVQTPYTNLTLPTPALVTYTDPMFWDDQPNGAQPCSKWLTLFAFKYPHEQGIFGFQRCFCVCSDGAMVQIHLSVLADNSATFTLCDSTGTTVAPLLSVPSTNIGAFHLPPRDTTVNLILKKGRYCIKADVYNFYGSPTGINVCGSIKGPGLTKDICCEPSSISGIKFIDTICSIPPFAGSLQTLQGWQIVLCNQQGVAIDTVTTDQNGYYNFSPLLPGLYTVKELNQSGWTPSQPAGGMSSLFLDANQVAQVDFANCPPEIDSCCRSKYNFIQNAINAVQLDKDDSLCKVKINVLRLPSCDSIVLINWGDGQTVHGPFGTGMWMHTYSQSGTYIVQIPIVEFDSNGKPCFDTLIKFTIDIHCRCECGRYTMNMLQNGSLVQIQCNDTISMNCPAPQPISVFGQFGCLGDSCSTPNIQWNLTGPSTNLLGNASPGNFQINLPGPLNPGYSVLNLMTTCGMQKCSCKIILYQLSCALPDSCTTFCNGNSWNQLNTSWIQDMAVYQGKLIAAGSFNTIGNPAIAVSNIAAWNGTSWAPLAGGGLNSKVNDIEVHNGLLYAGGDFTIAGNTPANHIASWNGSSWSAIPQGGINGAGTTVDALLSSAWGLVVGGRFNSVGNAPISANNIARWNPGPGWATFGNGFNGPVFALSTFYGNIVAGGRFDNSPGGLNNVAVWLGYWGKIGTGGGVNLNAVPPNSGDGIHALVQYKNELIVAGQFPNAVSTTVQNGNKTQHLAQWNGAYWTTLGTGPNPPGSTVNTGNGVYALKVINNELYVGGHFSQINNQNINLLAKWNGTTWSALNHPSTGIVRAIALYSPNKDSLCNLYTGGEVLFNQLKCSGVGTRDQSPSLNVTIYPNPTTGQLNIQFNENIREEIEIGIYSLLGQRIWHQVIPKINSAHPTRTIQINELSMGTYIIKVATVKGSVVRKIIKG